jgi:hypothetical protein
VSDVVEQAVLRARAELRAGTHVIGWATGVKATETAHRRATGTHPSSRPDVRAPTSERQRAHADAGRADDGGRGFSGQPSEFRHLILPRIADATPSELARATGLSAG